jgi:uncharacterized membrane protein
VRAENLHALVLVALVLGLGASAFAAYESTHPSATSVCSVNSYVSCAKVDQSGQTTTLGVPDWAIGIGGYVAMLALDIPLIRTWRRDLLNGLTLLSLGGVGVSVYFAYVELVRIAALCPVCWSAYLCNLAAFGALLALWVAGRSDPGAAPEADAGGSASAPSGDERSPGGSG